MEFDNAAFERKIDTTLTSLAKLEKALKLEGASKGLQDVSASADKVHFGGMHNALEGISGGFLAMATVGITALANITSAAMNAGVQIAKHLFGPIKDGFGEYETNLNSIQTIMANTASKGTTMGQVTDSLDKLNEYSDKTIYNFGQMAKNIGTFTAAGVDLDSSVNAIKGIANLAAMSGSTSDQASSAMYQLSQAMASGSVKAQDWISVVNAGMGGEAFQSSLYESAKALGTLTGVPVDQTFTEWKDAGGNFKEAMSEGVFTSEVLSTTLQGFTGDLSDAELAAKGFTEAQIASIQATAKTAQSAATEVKTFTQLMGTVKEAVGTGWADSMKIIIGDFGEAKHTWTALNTGISNFVKRNADARNELLQGWKDLGGRAQLIEGFHSAISNIGTILGTVSKAFRDIFPPTTAQQLFNLTETFVKFTKALQPSEQTIQSITKIAHGFFSILEIGWTILKSGVGFIKDLISALSGLGGGSFLAAAGKIGDFFTNLNEKLVSGGAIKSFFEDLFVVAERVIGIIGKVKDKIVDFFGSLGGDSVEGTGTAVEALGDRMEGLATLGDKLKDVWNGFIEGTKKVKDVIADIWGALSEFFGTLGSKIGDVLSSNNWDAGLDGIKVGLFGGITAILYKFMKDGLKLDFGQFGLIDSIKATFGELTGVLSAMQQNIKADTLMKIAGAIAMLTASVLVLSLIDADALAKALTAMAVGFGQLMGAFAILNKMDASVKATANMTLMSVGMTAMAGAMVILATAVAILSRLSWEELAVGLSGVTAMMGIMVGAVLLLEDHTDGMIKIGAGMTLMATALAIIAGVVQLFAQMSLSELAQGFGAVAVGLVIIAAALQLMPEDASKQGRALISIATSLTILAFAIDKYSKMTWGEMAQGLTGLAVTLGLLIATMHLMPADMPAIGLGLLVVAGAIMVLAQAVQVMANMSWDDMIRGLTGIAVTLGLLAAATYIMQNTILGSLAITIAAAALLLLVQVVKQFADISWGDLLKGLAGIALTLGVLAIAALLIQPAIPALLMLGAALVVIGAGFAMFGAGAYLVAQAFEKLASVSSEGADAFVHNLEMMGKAIPAFAKGLALGFVEFIRTVGEFAPEIIGVFVKIIGALLDALTGLVPKVVSLIISLLKGVIAILKTWYPMLIEAGIEIILALLGGIASAIPKIVVIVGELIVNFLNALAGLLGPIIEAGVNLIVAFLEGLTQGLPRIIDAAVTLVLTIIQALADQQNKIISAGLDLLLSFLKGIADNLNKVIDAAFDIVIKFMEGIANNLFRLAATATDLVVKFMDEIGNNVSKVTEAAGTLITQIMEALSKEITKVIDKGVELVEQFLKGLSGNIVRIANAVGQFIVDVLDGIAAAITTYGEEIRGAGMDIAFAIADGMTFGLASKARGVAQDAWDLGKKAADAVASGAGVKSPSKLTFYVGQMMGQGLSIGIRDSVPVVEESAERLADKAVRAIEASLTRMSTELETVSEFNPTVTPVLDLTRVAAGAAQIGDYIAASSIAPGYSYSQARTIASTANAQQDDSVNAAAGSGEVVFNQVINSPTQLSTSDIYKNTRNQITMAKQELSIP